MTIGKLFKKTYVPRDKFDEQSHNKNEYQDISNGEYVLPENGKIDQNISPEQQRLLLENTPILQQMASDQKQPVAGAVYSQAVGGVLEPEEDKVEVEKVKGPELTARVKLYLGLVLLVTLVCSCMMALPAPFFPQEAAKKGASSTFVGLIFSVFEFIVFTVSPVLGRYMAYIGPNFIFISGVSMSGCTTVVFGLLYLCSPGTTFVTLSLLIRVLEALGHAGVTTSCVTILCHFFPNNYASVYAVACSLTSLGCMLGPPIGAVFFEIGGFGLPFFVLGGTTLLLLPLLMPVLPHITATPKELTTTSSSKSKPVSVLARSGLVWAGILGLFMSAVGNSFLQPVLATHLETYGLSPFMIGICFALHPILYTVFTPLLGLLTDKLNIKGPLLLVSSIGCCVAYILIGPTPFLSFLPRELWLVLLGYMILGVSEAGLTIPTAKCLSLGATELGFPSDVRTHGIMSGLNVCGFHFGAFVGPLLAGTLTDVLGFGRSTFIISCLFLVTFAIFCSILGHRHRKKRHEDSEKPEERAPLIQQTCSCIPCKDVESEDHKAVKTLEACASTPVCNRAAVLSE